MNWPQRMIRDEKNIAISAVMIASAVIAALLPEQAWQGVARAGIWAAVIVTAAATVGIARVFYMFESSADRSGWLFRCAVTLAYPGGTAVFSVYLVRQTEQLLFASAYMIVIGIVGFMIAAMIDASSDGHPLDGEATRMEKVVAVVGLIAAQIVIWVLAVEQIAPGGAWHTATGG